MNRGILIVPLLLALVLGGCREARQADEEVLRFIDSTEGIAREFTFRLTEPDRELVATGEVQDSFRYRVLLRINGIESMEQVVDDDSLAIRVINPEGVPGLVEGTLPTSTVILDALRSGQWVIDPSGAPPLETRRDEPGSFSEDDPLLLAAYVLRHVRIAVNEARLVKEWQEEDIDPAYRPSEDNFPHANIGEGERRFDLVRPPLQRPGGELGALEQEAKPAMFRKMAIYVEDGQITRVIEEVNIESHPDFVDARTLGRTRMLEFMEQLKLLTGTRQIIERKMSVAFKNFGKKISIRQPEEGLRTSLKGLFSQPAAPQSPEVPAGEAESAEPGEEGS